MAGWILARGRQAEQTLPEVIPAGANTLTLPEADQIFSVGDLLFVSEADEAGTEFLGAAVSVSAEGLGFALAARASKNVGARLWRAEASFQTHAEEALPLKATTSTGVAVERSLGGRVYAVRVAEPATTIDWGFEELTPERARALGDWIAAELEGGALAFTLIGPDRRLRAVRLAEGLVTETRARGGRHSARLRLLVEGEGIYL